MKNLQSSQGGPQEEDAMFTKKYVGPVDCASCEKGIVNLCGLRAENVNWNRLPFREPTERIARYGQGFSKFLAATGVVTHNDQQNFAMARQSSAHRHPVPNHQSHGDVTTTDYTKNESFASPHKQARSHMQKESKTEVKARKQHMATTLQATATHKPM